MNVCTHIYLSLGKKQPVWNINFDLEAILDTMVHCVNTLELYSRYIVDKQ